MLGKKNIYFSSKYYTTWFQHVLICVTMLYLYFIVFYDLASEYNTFYPLLSYCILRCYVLFCDNLLYYLISFLYIMLRHAICVFNAWLVFLLYYTLVFQRKYFLLLYFVGCFVFFSFVISIVVASIAWNGSK